MHKPCQVPRSQDLRSQGPLKGVSLLWVVWLQVTWLWTQPLGEEEQGAVSLLGKVYFHGKCCSDEGRIRPGLTLPHTYSEIKQESPRVKRELAISTGNVCPSSKYPWKRPFSSLERKKSLCLRVLQRNKLSIWRHMSLSLYLYR